MSPRRGAPAVPPGQKHAARFCLGVRRDPEHGRLTAAADGKQGRGARENGLAVGYEIPAREIVVEHEQLRFGVGEKEGRIFVKRGSSERRNPRSTPRPLEPEPAEPVYSTAVTRWLSSHLAMMLRSWNSIAPQLWQTIIKTLSVELDEQS